MIRRAKLYARYVNKPDGSYPRKAVEFHGNGKPIKPPFKTAEGWELVAYQIRIGERFIGLDDNFEDAVARWKLEQGRLSGGVERSEAENPKPVVVDAEEDDGRVRIATAAAKFVAEMKNLDRKKYTVAMYENALRDFQKACPKVLYVEDITREAVLNFLGWMRKNLAVRVPGQEEVTYKNKLRYLSTFLGRQGILLYKQGNRQGVNDPGLLFRTDRPKPNKKKPKKYDGDQIAVLKKHADDDEMDYLELLLWSGFRNGEIEHLLYADFDFKKSTVGVHAKPQFGWKPKDSEERIVTLPSPVTARIKARMNRPQQFQDGMRKPTLNDLVFTTQTGAKDAHLIRRLHRLVEKVNTAEKTNINLKGKRAGHMFRKTAGSRYAKKHGLPNAMEFLGHSDIETTALYMAADDHAETKKRRDADEMYAAGD